MLDLGRLIEIHAVSVANVRLRNVLHQLFVEFALHPIIHVLVFSVEELAAHEPGLLAILW